MNQMVSWSLYYHVLVPLKQFKNTKSLMKKLQEMIQQKDLTPDRLATMVKSVKHQH